MADFAPVSPRSSATQPTGSPILTAGGIVLAIAGLYLGRDIFVPFALAILLSFVLTLLVNFLGRWSFNARGRAPSAVFSDEAVRTSGG